MKRKMLTVNTLAVGNLKHRRKQYSIMIIGILLAMVFSSSVLFFLFSLNASEAAMKRTLYGNQNMAWLEADEAVLEEARSKNLIEAYGTAHDLGYVYTDDEQLGAAVAWSDEAFRSIQEQSLLEGEYPTAANEIAAEKSALVRLGVEPKVGATLKVKMKVQNGMKWLEQPVDKELTVVGILRDKKANFGQYYYTGDDSFKNIPCIFTADNTLTEPGGKALTVGYFKIKNIGDIYKDDSPIVKFFEDKELSLWESDHFMEMDSRWLGSGLGDLTGKIEFAVVLAVVLTVASALIIVNAFNANLKERKKQIGLLRAVGTTKRQIIHIFSREALLISLICAPMSLLISLFGVKLLASWLFDDTFVFVAKWWVLIVCVVISVITVMLASLIPLLSASKTTPMQAIRNIDAARKLKNTKIKTQRSYRPQALLAKRNEALHRGSRFAVIFMLVITIVISCVGFTALMQEYNYSYDTGYDYEFWGIENDVWVSGNLINTATEGGMTENDRQQLLSFPYIKTADGVKSCYVNLQIPEFSDYFVALAGDFSAAYWYNYQTDDDSWYMPTTKAEWEEYAKTREYNEDYQAIKQRFGVQGEYFPTGLSAGSSESIAELESAVIDGKIDIAKLNSGEQILLLAPEKAAFYVQREKRYDGYFSSVDKDSDIKPDREYLVEGECPYRAGDKLVLDIYTASAQNMSEDTYDTELGYSLPPDIQQSKKEVTVGAIISPERFSEMNSVLHSNSYYDLGFFTTTQGMEHFVEGRKYQSMSLKAVGALDDETDAAITEYLEPIATRYNAQATSVYQMHKETKTAVRTAMMSLAAIIILFFAISASVINNTLAAGIRENKRELGTLRAVGASSGVLVMSYIRQLLSMFAWGYGFGFLATLLLFIGFSIYSKMMEGNFRWSDVVVWPALVMCLLLFAMCAMNLWSKVHKEMKNSIVENIREL